MKEIIMSRDELMARILRPIDHEEFLAQLRYILNNIDDTIMGRPPLNLHSIYSTVYMESAFKDLKAIEARQKVRMDLREIQDIIDDDMADAKLAHQSCANIVILAILGMISAERTNFAAQAVKTIKAVNPEPKSNAES